MAQLRQFRLPPCVGHLPHASGDVVIEFKLRPSAPKLNLAIAEDNTTQLSLGAQNAVDVSANGEHISANIAQHKEAATTSSNDAVAGRAPQRAIARENDATT